MKQLKVTVTRKSDPAAHPEPEDSPYLDELTHLIQGYQKKGDNLKLMVEKLNQHDCKQANGDDWDYASLQQLIKDLKL